LLQLQVQMLLVGLVGMAAAKKSMHVQLIAQASQFATFAAKET
jgi:hypothetical protein